MCSVTHTPRTYQPKCTGPDESRGVLDVTARSRAARDLNFLHSCGDSAPSFMTLELHNPHSILAALHQRPRAVRQLMLSPQVSGDVWAEVEAAARSQRVAVSASTPSTSHRSHRSGRNPVRETERASASFAIVEPPSPVPLNQLWAPGSGPGIWLALDQVQDPQNLGAIFRLAGFFGVRGIVMMKDRSASLTAAACDVAAGGAEYVPFSVVANLAQAIEKAQQSEVWVLGTCERAASSIASIRRDRHWMLIVGNEGEGLRRLTRERCDQLVSVPAPGPIPSLNVATATAACLAVLTLCSDRIEG